MTSGPRLPKLGSREVCKAFGKLGFCPPSKASASSHQTWRDPGPPPRHVTLIMGEKDIPHGTVAAQIAQAGVTISEFLLGLGGSHARAERKRLENETKRSRSELATPNRQDIVKPDDSDGFGQ